jgi:Sulfotransferase family
VAAPILALGVRRSGTTLLRVMLDRSSELAIPDESYFIPQLAHRHGSRPDPDEFVEDLRRLKTLEEWELPVAAVEERLRPGMTTGEAIGAIFAAYAAQRGKTRWGDKTPLYMQYVGLLERLFPDAVFVHLIRDGRDAATSFLAMPEGVVTRTWAHPRSISDFACQWDSEVRAARSLGERVGSGRYLEVRYEALVGDPGRELRRICEFASLPYEPAMLDYAGTVDVSAKPHQQSLKQAPTAGLRDWRRDLSREDALAFEAVAGELLQTLGYGLLEPGRSRPLGASARLARYRTLTAAWRASGYIVQRSPLWRRRHARVTASP